MLDHSIDHLSEVMRNAIESSSRIKDQLVIYQEEFLIDEVSLSLP